MDTRAKIVSLDRAAELAEDLRRQDVNVKAVSGCFDVLLAEHVRELRSIRDGHDRCALIAFVSPPRDPVLSERARAELVAALAAVDYVVTSPDGGEEFLKSFPANDVVRMEAADERRAQQLIEHVQSRQSA